VQKKKKKKITWSKNCKGSSHISQTQDLPDGKLTGSSHACNIYINNNIANTGLALNKLNGR
jgi:hypothetical protein